MSQSFFKTTGLGPAVGLQNHGSTAVVQTVTSAGPFSAESLSFLRICLSLPNSVLQWALRVPVLTSLYLEVGSLRSIEILWNTGSLNLDNWKERLWAFSLSFFSFSFSLRFWTFLGTFLRFFLLSLENIFTQKSTAFTTNNNANTEKWK